MPKQAKRTILVTGDVVADHDIYCAESDTFITQAKLGTIAVSHLGGAFLPYSILRQLQAQQEEGNAADQLVEVVCGLKEDVRAGSAYVDSAYGLWKSYPGEKTEVWRLAKPLGMGYPRAGLFDTSPYSTIEKDPDILVIDDGNRGFRSNRAREAWPGFILDQKSDRTKWVVLKMSGPVGQGDLWRALQPFRERLVVLVSIDEIRREEVMVTKGISWERTALELVRELTVNPVLKPLHGCSHLIVSFRSAGALHVNRSGADGPIYTLHYDPRHLEGEWSDGIAGGMFGYSSCLTAGITHALAQSNGDKKNTREDIAKGVCAGLAASRRLHLCGHGPVVKAEPGLQFGDIAAEILAPTIFYAATEVPAANEDGDHADPNWTIITGGAQTEQQKKIPLYGLAQRIVWNGRQALGAAPHAEFGNYLTVDRDEIEGLRNLNRLVLDYERSSSVSKPLSIGVFGQPGSGKSFIVTQIAKGALGSDVPIIEFNLSQFDEPEDLIGAFHQVRDKVLEGRTPVVFWDEFDSRQYFWLQYLLAPMQDGKFQEGQITHPIGKSVFIFAGGTSFDLSNFGPDEERDPDGFRKFKMVKGPDFTSRLHGNLDVLGPNPRQVFNADTGSWEVDEADVSFPVRRALLMRALLRLGENESLVMDSGICAALLEIDRYTHGARSMENVLTQMMYRSGSHPIKRSDLPPKKAISMHVDFDKLLAIVRQNESFKGRVDEAMAEAVHEFYRELGKIKGWSNKYDMPYSDLPEGMKESNRAAAARIPEVLSIAGLYVVPNTNEEDVTLDRILAVIEKHKEKMAEAEHKGWREHLERNGWVQVDRDTDPDATRDDERRIHNVLVPYDELSEEEKGKDRKSVASYPDLLHAAGYKIVDSLK